MSRTKHRSQATSASMAAPAVTSRAWPSRAWPSRVLLLGIVGGAALAVLAGLRLVSDLGARHDAGTEALDDVVRGLLGAVLVVLGAWVGIGCIASIACATIARLRGSVRVPRIPGIPAFLHDLSGRALRLGAVVVLAAGPSTAGAFDDPTAVVPPTMVVVGAPPPATPSSISGTVPPSRPPTTHARERPSTGPGSPTIPTMPLPTLPTMPTTSSAIPTTSSTRSPWPAVSGSVPPIPTAAPHVPGTISPGSSPSAAATSRGAPDVAQSHVVRTGEHFWSIAEEAVRVALGQEPSDAQTHRYWQRLVRANRTRLVDPADDDLIIPGQVLELPPVR